MNYSCIKVFSMFRLSLECEITFSNNIFFPDGGALLDKIDGSLNGEFEIPTRYACPQRTSDIALCFHHLPTGIELKLELVVQLVKVLTANSHRLGSNPKCRSCRIIPKK